jgi:glycosyltransferase involved in cell wall biosynthesis
LAADLNIRDSVEFLGVQSDIVGLLQQSWGFALPSRNEGMSNALLEAMACGLPCVATRVSGSEDVIADGLNGILVEPDQPTQMAEALRRLLEDSELAQRLGHEARATVVRDYQLSHNVERCLALYRHVLAEQAQRTSRS